MLIASICGLLRFVVLVFGLLYCDLGVSCGAFVLLSDSCLLGLRLIELVLIMFAWLDDCLSF